MASDGELTQTVTAWQQSLLKIIDRINTQMAIYAAEFETEEGYLQSTANNIQQANALTNQLNAELAASGYQGAVAALSADVARIVNDALGDDADSARIADSLVRTFQQDTVRTLDNSWFEITGAMRQAVETAVLGQAPARDLIIYLAGEGERETIRITAPLKAPMAVWVNWASAAVDTTVSALNRMMQLTKAQKAGVKLFSYSGTLIATSRPFCRIMHDIVLTIDELPSIETDPKLMPLKKLRNGDGNGQPGILQTLGGWRCRHILSATDADVAELFGSRFFSKVWPDLVSQAESELAAK